MNDENELSIRAVKQLIKNQTDKRVSEDTVDALRDEMEDAGDVIAKKAKEYANKDGRKTVRGKDVRDAVRELSKMETKVELNV